MRYLAIFLMLLSVTFFAIGCNKTEEKKTEKAGTAADDKGDKADDAADKADDAADKADDAAEPDADPAGK